MKIAIIEDHLMMRDVLRKACSKDFGHEVVVEEGDGPSAVTAIVKIRPDLVLLDLQLPGLDGFEVIERVRSEYPDCTILVLSSNCDEYTVYRVEQVHVRGFIDKNSSTLGVLKEAIAAVASGGVYFSESFKRAKAKRKNDPQAFDKILSERETTVAEMVGDLRSDVEIGQSLGISSQTVEKHRFNILKKLDLRSKAELERYARDHGFTRIRSGAVRR